jgi:hypothetical protein
MSNSLLKMAKVSILAFVILISDGANASSTFTVDLFNLRNFQFNANTVLDNARFQSILSGTPNASGQFSSVSFNDGQFNRGALRPVFGSSLFPQPFSNAYGVSASGTFVAPADDDYTFLIRSDDATRLVINGTSVFDSFFRYRGSFHTVALNEGVNTFSLQHYDRDGPGLLEIGLARGNTRNLDDFSVLSAAIPEPATWLMMIVGFAVVGLQVRRRHRRAVDLA